MKKFNLIISRGYMGLFYKEYTLATERMYLVASHPKLARAVADFNERNREILQDVEPMRPSMFYTAEGCKTLLKLDYKDMMNGMDYRFYMIPKGSKKVIGTVGLGTVFFGSVKSGTISYKVDKDYRRMGYCTEAVEEVINFAFNTLQLHRIDSLVMPRNEKSLGVMKKFGFEQEGLSKKCLEINGKWEDHYRFALINDKVSAKQNYD